MDRETRCRIMNKMVDEGMRLGLTREQFNRMVFAAEVLGSNGEIRRWLRRSRPEALEHWGAD